MVSSLKIELFAYDLFHTVWLKGGLISHKYDATQIYKIECLDDSDYEEVCDKLFYNAVLCRRILFQRTYMEEIMKEKDKYWNSESDFYEYIHMKCNYHDWFCRLTIFERIFATCAFVISLCFYNRENGNVDIIKYSHTFWVKYFDAYMEEFYKQGGWNELKKAASSYISPLMFLQVLFQDSDNALSEVAEAIKNYNNLKQTSIFEECETVSKLWVKSCVENLYRTNKNQVGFAGYINCLYTEYILSELKRLCSPCGLEVLEYDEECSARRIFDSDSFYIPLTPIASEESTSQRNSFLVSCNGIDDVLPASPTDNEETFSEIESDNSDFINQSKLNESEDLLSSNYCDDISSILDIFKQPFEYDGSSTISDQYLSRSMRKMHLNLETLELEEVTVSETESSSNTNDSYSVGENHVQNTPNQIHIPPKMTNKQCKMIENSLDTVELANGLSAIASMSGHKNGFEEGGFAIGTTISNTSVSYDKISISISQWDEKDLMGNISTPIKLKKS